MVGALPMTRRPSRVSTQSVKVPPTSMSTEFSWLAVAALMPPASRSGATSRPSDTRTSPAAMRRFSPSMSSSMSTVIGWPGGRYSVSICTPQPGQ